MRVFYFHNGSIGDFLMALHLAENIHASGQGASVRILIPRNFKACAELAEAYGYVQLELVNRFTILFKLAGYCFEALRARGGGFVITPPTPGTIPLSTKFIAKLIAICSGGTLIGFADEGRANGLFDTRLTFDWKQPYHETMHDIVRAMNCTVSMTEPSFSFTPVAGVYERLGVTERAYVVFHPFGSGENRSILGDDLAQTLSALSRSVGVPILLSGSGANWHMSKHVVEPFIADGSVIPIAGRVTMRELATLLRGARCYVGVDTGISHLAAMLGVRGVTAAHPASTIGWLPFYGSGMRVAYKLILDSEVRFDREHAAGACETPRCFARVSGSELIKTAEGWI